MIERKVPAWMQETKPPRRAVVVDLADLERRLSDLERRHDKTREYLIDVISFGTASVALAYFQPVGTIAMTVVFFGFLGVARRLLNWLMR